MAQVSGQHILVVDDEQHMVNSIKFVLSLENYRAATAADAREAIALIQRAADAGHSFDLIITDILMPEMSGFEMLEELQRLGFHIPVLVVTAMDGQKVQRELAKFGCRDYMNKPFDDCALLQKVADILKKNSISKNE